MTDKPSRTEQVAFGFAYVTGCTLSLVMLGMFAFETLQRKCGRAR